MNRPKPTKLDKKHPGASRDVMEEMKEMSGDRHPVNNDTRYIAPNRDRALGNADRTGRHFDEDVTAQDEGTEASEEHEAD